MLYIFVFIKNKFIKLKYKYKKRKMFYKVFKFKVIIMCKYMKINNF